jgi:hypothetical protein
MAGTRRSRKQSIVKTKKRIYGTGKIAKAVALSSMPIVASAFAKSKEKAIKKLKAKKVKKVVSSSKATPKVAVKRKHVGATKVSHSEYDKQKNQWVRHYN